MYSSITGQPYSAHEYDYSAGNALIGSNFYYTDVTGQAYTGEVVDYNGAGQLTSTAFAGVTGTGYSAYEYNSRRSFAGSKFSLRRCRPARHIRPTSSITIRRRFRRRQVLFTERPASPTPAKKRISTPMGDLERAS